MGKTSTMGVDWLQEPSYPKRLLRKGFACMRVSIMSRRTVFLFRIMALTFAETQEHEKQEDEHHYWVVVK